MGGKEAKPNAYPWTVALTGFPEVGNFFCGATIISSRFILTAGHCFYDHHKDWSFDKIEVKVGVHNLTDKDVLIVKPKAFKRYEGFTEENDIGAPVFDIALIELEEDLPITAKIRPICIHSKYFNYHINELQQNRNQFLFRRNTFDRNENFIDDNELEKRAKIDQQKEMKLQPSLDSIMFKASIEQPSDKSKIILDHPDKNLIRQVLSLTEIYYEQMRNDPVKIFDPAKEFVVGKLTVCGWGSTDKYDLEILPGVLIETEITQKRSDVCENAYGDDVFFRSKMICANEAGKF